MLDYPLDWNCFVEAYAVRASSAVYFASTACNTNGHSTEEQTVLKRPLFAESLSTNVNNTFDLIMRHTQQQYDG